MRKKKIKINTCLNCDFPLKSEYDYCPKCGQENHEFQLSFRHLIKDFFDNYFSFDSRFGRSIKPFFLAPGKLTTAFMEGKRMMYANPIRLYLVISLIHFFLLSISAGFHEEESPQKGIITTNEDDERKGPASIQFSSEEDADSLDTEDENWLLSGREFLLIKKMLDEKHSKREVLDSLHVQDRPFFQRHIIGQLVKMQASEQGSIRGMILKNIPILMFILLPIYALILKLFFIKRLYIHHLIHSLHIHCFTFLVLSGLWISNFFGPNITQALFPFVLLLLSIYILLSFRSTYQIRYFQAFYKVLLSGFLYSLMLGVGLLVEIVVSFIFF